MGDVRQRANRTPVVRRTVPEGKDGPLQGVGQATLDKLGKLGIDSAFDLVLHLPLRYEDETHLYPIAHAPLDQTVLVQGTIMRAEVQQRPRKTLICRVGDPSGDLSVRFLHFYGSQVKALSPGKKLRLLGEIRRGFFGAEMIHPRYRIVEDETPLAEALTPVYPTTAGLSQDALRRLIRRGLATEDLSETVPESVLRAQGFGGFAESIALLHQPPPEAPRRELCDRSHPAWRRIKFDELLAQQLSMRLHHERRRSRQAPVLAGSGRLTGPLLAALTFALTGAQRKALEDISRDLGQPHPMQRLLQGDVGSGKTVVAALASAQAMENGFQAAFMAPTEILAEQHFRKLAGWFGPLGVNPAWLSASLTKKEKEAALRQVADGTAQLAVGTHALFQDQVAFRRLGLVVVDEQHRFGVEQRLALRNKGLQPHQLMMSATPIPRTLAMSYYADLDVSVIDQLPPGRTPVVTKLVADTRRDEVVARIRRACEAGAQAYWVCPLIEPIPSLPPPGKAESDFATRSRRGRAKGEDAEAAQLQTALETHRSLSETFPDLRVGLVHGRLPAREKAEVMAAFQNGEIQLLVATTVIEVGVDVANASLMVIEHAERMGLSQLHQLRGRVGRGAAQSVCILLYQNPISDTARARLKIIYENSDGFEIARQDLRLRGPGELLGARQSGVPMLRFADLQQDTDLLEAARQAAQQILRCAPEMAERHLQRWFNRRQDYLKA